MSWRFWGFGGRRAPCRKLPPTLGPHVTSPGAAIIGGTEFVLSQKPPHLSVREWISETPKERGISHSFDESWYCARVLKESTDT